MRTLTLIFLLSVCGISYGDPPVTPRYSSRPVTSITTPFGSSTITRRSDGSRMTSQRFGSGTISRESFRGGGSATHTTSRFGSGTITRSVYRNFRR